MNPNVFRNLVAPLHENSLPPDFREIVIAARLADAAIRRAMNTSRRAVKAAMKIASRSRR